MQIHSVARSLTSQWPDIEALDEPAFAQLKRSALDYIAIETPGDVITALERLRAAPAQYLAMVDNGHRRGAASSAQATKERWMRFLLDEVIPDAIAWREALQASRFGWLAQLRAMARQKIATKRFKFRVYREGQQQSYLRTGGSGL